MIKIKAIADYHFWTMGNEYDVFEVVESRDGKSLIYRLNVDSGELLELDSRLDKENFEIINHTQ